MKNIFKIIKISRPLYKLVFLLSFLILSSSILELIAPILSKFIVDDIVLNIQYKSGNISHLALLIILAFLSSMLSLIITTLSDRLGDHTAGKFRKFLTEKFYFKVLALPQSYFDSELSGKIINQLNRGIQSIQDFINTSSNFILPAILQSIFTIVILAFYNIPIAIFMLLLFPIYMIISYYSTIKWGKEEIEKNKIEDATRGRIQEVILNIPLVKSFNNELNEYKNVKHNLAEINKIYARQSKTFHIFDFFRGLSLNLVLLFINIIVFYNTFKGSLSLGEMVLILQLVSYARRPLFAMSFILTRIQTAESGSKQFFEILSLKSSEKFGQDFKKQKIKNPTIEFKNVSFNYNGNEKVLDNVSFKIESHQKVALVGHSGAGKTTIVNLILKFYAPSSGEIFLNNVPYKKLNHQLIRDNIGLVFQENELFSSTVKENVAYGKPNATDKEIINALKLANAYDFVTKFAKGIESEIGERGVKLSGGQKQRIQIARAILKDAPILILDEATSSLDAKSEKEVHDALEHLMKGRLVIIIAHRFSTIQNVDKIIVVDKGKIADSGSPQALAKRKGIYADLLNYQIEGNKKLLEKFDLQ
ncbi:MAG: ABC transporter ATP-binding protein/permease [Actinobacteria bacterium]|nr:ABC transporter ATP-binding protein/permease [Actinomycetota bacterium]